MNRRWIIAAAVATPLVAPLAPMAQTVYESKDKAGPVFSDQPSPGAKAVQLQAPNVIGTPAVKPPAPSPAAGTAPAPAPYRRFVIARPAEQGMVHTNTGEFGIDANLSPPLRPSDRVRVLLDGNLLPTAYRSTNLRISEADWQAAAVSINGEHSLQLVVVGADGKPSIETAPVRFYARRAAVGGRAR
jgi:hypothetical protein